MFITTRAKVAVRFAAGSGMIALLLGAGGLAATASEVVPPAPAPAPVQEAPAAVEAAPAPAEADLVPEVVPIVTSPPLPAGTVGVDYAYQLTSNVSPATFSVSGLPAGLYFDASNARIVGTPILVGSSTVRLEAFGEAATDVTEARFDPLDIVAPAVEPAHITSLPLAVATIGVPYSFQLTSNVSPVRFDVTGLPAGLTAAPLTGLISGIPTTAGSVTVRLEAVGERVGEVTEVVYATLVVAPAPAVVPVITSLPLPSGSVGAAYSFQLTASVPAATFSATGLPAGLSLNRTTGVISGTPQRVGSFTVGLAAVVGRGGDVSQTAFVTLVIGPEIAVVDPTTPPAPPADPSAGSPGADGSAAVDPTTASTTPAAADAAARASAASALASANGISWRTMAGGSRAQNSAAQVGAGSATASHARLLAETGAQLPTAPVAAAFALLAVGLAAALRRRLTRR